MRNQVPILNRKSRRGKLSAILRGQYRRRLSNAPQMYDQVLLAPPKLSLAFRDPNSLAFFRQLRELISRRDKTIRSAMVDLAGTKKLDLGSALTLVAEFDRWQRLNYTILYPGTVSNWDPTVRNELHSLGFFKLLKTNLPPLLWTQQKNAWIQFVSDTMTIGRAATLLRRRMQSELGGESGYEQDIYIVLVEAMKNAFQHAYPDDQEYSGFDQRVGKRWWMAASIDDAREFIEVAFLDLGITIPKSLPYSWMWQHLANEAKVGSDVAQIVAALEYGHSRLGQPHRGKGFQNIMKPAKLNPENVVTILSGQGICYITASRVIGLPTSERFEGTLISWKLSLKKGFLGMESE